jgi:hypothetical protein
VTPAQGLVRSLAALAAAASTTGALAAGPAHAASSGDARAASVASLTSVAGEEAFSFADTQINEASALAALAGGRFATVNDSGDTGRVFVVDARGRTVGTTTWEQSPRDVEALAPAPDGDVWVGDIGDNSASRPHIQVAKVPVGPGERTAHPTVYTLVYPDGAHDAETLLCDPATGRLYVATKGWLGGTLYAAPARLVAGQDNALTAVGAVMPMATDGAFLPGGDEVLIRGYFGATTYTWPAMDKIASFRLPDQPQGEGVGVTPDGTVYLSSEGLHAAVLRFRLPAAAVSSGRTSPGSDAASSVSTGSPSETPDSGSSWWLWPAGGVVGAAALGVLLMSLRRR